MVDNYKARALAPPANAGGVNVGQVRSIGIFDGISAVVAKKHCDSPGDSGIQNLETSTNNEHATAVDLSHAGDPGLLPARRCNSVKHGAILSNRRAATNLNNGD